MKLHVLRMYRSYHRVYRGIFFKLFTSLSLYCLVWQSLNTVACLNDVASSIIVPKTNWNDHNRHKLFVRTALTYDSHL
ncbi:hypothetical protein DER45DRAFT_558462, partial [Fusarium avenaceum]